MARARHSDQHIVRVAKVQAAAERLAAFVVAAREIDSAIGDDIEGLAAAPSINLAAAYAYYRAAQEAVEEFAKEMKTRVDILRTNILPERFDAENLETMTVDGIGRFTRTERLFASIVDRGKGYAWLRKNGGADLIVETVNASTLSGFAKARLEEQGKDLPEPIFKTTLVPNISLTRIK